MVCNPQERNLYELCWCFHCKVGTESSEPQQGTQLLGGFHVCHGFVTFRAPPLTQWMAPEPYPEFLVRFKVLFLWFLCLCMRKSYLTNLFSLSSYQNFWSQWFLANPVGIRLLSDWVCSSCKVPTWILQVCCGFAEESSVPRPHFIFGIHVSDSSQCSLKTLPNCLPGPHTLHRSLGWPRWHEISM